MVALLLIIALLIAGWVVTAYLLGFRLGSSSQAEELMRIRSDAIAAERRLQDVARQAYEAMVEHVDHYRREQS